MGNKVTSDEGLDLIKSFEGLRLEPYRCPAGVWTIGYGHTRHVKPTDLITKVKAEIYLKEDLQEAEAIVNSSVTRELEQCQFDSLVCFVYNIGGRAFKKSTLLKKVNLRKDREVVAEFLKWDKCSVTKVINGEKVIVKEPVAGLTRRRKAEADLWMKAI